MLHVPPPHVIDRWRESLWTIAGGCLVPTYRKGNHGYVSLGWRDGGERHTQLAHRIAWYVAHGEVPCDLTVDHLCRNRQCSNVEHLRLLTNAENGRLNGHVLKTHCPKGHPYDEQNTYHKYKAETGRTGRECKQCRNALVRNWKRRKRAEQLANA